MSSEMHASPYVLVPLSHKPLTLH